MKYFALFSLVFAYVAAQAQCLNSGEILNLGADTLLCQGQTLPLSAPAGYDNYVWSTGSNSETITVDAAGTYSVSASILGENIVVNGNFESGNTGFTTQYVIGTGGAFGLLSNAGTYAIATSPNLAHNNFMPCQDVTPAPGTQMMVVNGAASPGLNVWCQTVPVSQNTVYQFSAWASNALNDANVAQLQFSINSSSIGPTFTTLPQGCNWQQYFQIWNSGLNTTANICIVNLNTNPSGNDFMLDDISFAPVCVDADTIVVTTESFSMNAGEDITFCANEPETITATTSGSNVSFSWSNGTNGATLTPTTSGTYAVFGTSLNGCVFEDEVNVTVIPVDWSLNDFIMQPSSCGENTGAVGVQINGSFPPNTTTEYLWTGPGPNSANVFTASVWNGLAPGWYYATVTNSGCSQSDSVLVTVLDPPIASFTGSPLTGFAPLNVTFNNSSQNANSYFWNFGNGETQNTSDLSSVQSQFNEEGTYNVMLVAQNGNCFDTAYVTVVVTLPPVIVPVNLITANVFSPNGDGVNDTFFFTVENIVELNIVIVNRWGQVVYESDEATFEWDGTSVGVECAEGVYFYSYTAKGAQGESFEGHGFVHLVRK
jgi:gliding motility-associated-like protein